MPGVTVATIDTGVEYTHEALVEHYRGNNHDGSFNHDYNWWDPTGICGDTPCDNAGHGTHTMGTIVGGDLDGPLPDIGVAPGAEWIAAKGCEDFDCSEGSLLSSGQFMIAPTDLEGNNPRPGPAARHRQQLVGQRRPQRHVLPGHGPGLARGRHHPGLRRRQRRTGLQHGRHAGPVHRGHQRRRDR